MKQGTAIALLFGLALAWAGMAHDHPPPTNCPGFCSDTQCRCVKSCDAAGKHVPDPCYADCYQEKLACDARCELTMEDCRNTDRCSRPRG